MKEIIIGAMVLVFILVVISFTSREHLCIEQHTEWRYQPERKIFTGKVYIHKDAYDYPIEVCTKRDNTKWQYSL